MSAPAVKSSLRGLVVDDECAYRARRNLWSDTWTVELEPGLSFALDRGALQALRALLDAVAADWGGAA